MASLEIIPGALALRIYRGDDIGFKITLQQSGSPIDAPTSGWSAQIRARANPDSPVLATFAIDASEAADGVLRLSLTGSETLALPKKAQWDIQCDANGVRTYLAGDLLVDEQVTQ